jgi:hypothetical protein
MAGAPCESSSQGWIGENRRFFGGADQCVRTVALAQSKRPRLSRRLRPICDLDCWPPAPQAPCVAVDLPAFLGASAVMASGRSHRLCFVRRISRAARSVVADRLRAEPAFSHTTAVALAHKRLSWVRGPMVSLVEIANRSRIGGKRCRYTTTKVCSIAW